MGRLWLLIQIISACAAGHETRATAEPWRFAMTCDSRGNVITGINEQIIPELTREILRWDVDFVVFPGDLVYGARVGAERFESQLWNWVAAMEPLYQAGVGVYVCRGNHEIGDMWDAMPGEAPDPTDNYAVRWLNVFGNSERPGSMLPATGPWGEQYMSYFVTHKNALIVVLDQYAGMRHYLAHFVNQAWLDTVLAANTHPHVFVLGHEPAFKTLHWDCLDDHPAWRDAFWDSLRAAGARVYLCGHDHFYDHARVDDGDGRPENDVHQFIVGAAGAYPYTWTPPYDGENGRFSVTQIYHAERYGYVVVEVDDLDVTVTWMERQCHDLLAPGVYKPRDVWRYTAANRPVTCKTKPAADLNGDCVVDFSDLLILASQWLIGAEHE